MTFILYYAINYTGVIRLKCDSELAMGLFDIIRSGLRKTREGVLGRLAHIFKTEKIDAETIDRIEEILLEADLGVEAVESLIETIKEFGSRKGDSPINSPIDALRSELTLMLSSNGRTERRPRFSVKPWVILMVGVNGSGKTTTAGKLAYLFSNEGKKVAIAAGDTFRAAAVEQIEIWANRSGARLIRQERGADPGAVVYDAYQSVRARDEDVLIVDTAGRLQDNRNLMAELGKIRRVLERLDDAAPHEVMLVMDATTGQNGLSQARGFGGAAGLTGLVITKLDGTARGGVVVPIYKTLEVPIEFIGIGERVEDLLPFEPAAFVNALLGD